MPTDPTAFYILIFIIAGIALLAIALGISYWLLFSKYKILKEEVFANQKNEGAKFQKNIDEAKRESMKILTEAQNAAKEVVLKAQEINKTNTSDLSNLVNENLQSQKLAYDKALNAISQNIEKTFQNLPEDMKNQVQSEVTQVVSALDSEMKNFQANIQKSLVEPYQAALKDAEIYKEARIKAFESSLFTVLSNISKEVLRKELSIDEHEKLVMKALAEAKAAGIL